MYQVFLVPILRLFLYSNIFIVLKLFLTVFFIYYTLFANAQLITNPKVLVAIADTNNKNNTIQNSYKVILDSNRFLNFSGTPQALSVLPNKQHNNQVFFYLIALLFFILGITRSFYNKYFTTLLRVFFNSTLKQNQLTDQLTQAKTPSLIFNIFFIITGGIYLFFLIKFNTLNKATINNTTLLPCLSAIGISYLIKYLSLKFTGWLTGYEEEANTYIFIIFLLNKMIGLFLLPVVTIMAFCNIQIVSIITLFSFMVLIVIFFVRVFRSYSLLQTKLKITLPHFILYVTALEVIPIFLISKLMSQYLLTNT